MMNVDAKVHVNSFFYSPFPLQRGVRQGDPLAPLLFVLFSQPLMKLVDLYNCSEENLGLKMSEHANFSLLALC